MGGGLVIKKPKWCVWVIMKLNPLYGKFIERNKCIRTNGMLGSGYMYLY